MEAYSSFAQVYDLFMDNIPYDSWAEEIIGIFRQHGIENGIVADLGCGTGQLTRRLRDAGYDMIGIDNSPEMLDVAISEEESGSTILYLEQDLLEMELYGTVRACFSVCDTLNYLLSEEELTAFFKLVNNYLDPEGIFLFDCNTPAFYEAIGSSTIAENREDASFIWENDYDTEEEINEYRMTFYIRDRSVAGTDPLYRRYEELHTHRPYSLASLKSCLAKAGLVFLNAFDADTGGTVSETTGRIMITARENGKVHRK